jgi:Skp family chaperone for outer membrane proteins
VLAALRIAMMAAADKANDDLGEFDYGALFQVAERAAQLLTELEERAKAGTR